MGETENILRDFNPENHLLRWTFILLCLPRLRKTVGHPLMHFNQELTLALVKMIGVPKHYPIFETPRHLYFVMKLHGYFKGDGLYVDLSIGKEIAISQLYFDHMRCWKIAYNFTITHETEEDRRARRERRTRRRSTVRIGRRENAAA
jgi:hypothetical protein